MLNGGDINGTMLTGGAGGYGGSVSGVVTLTIPFPVRYPNLVSAPSSQVKSVDVSGVTAKAGLLEFTPCAVTVGSQFGDTFTFAANDSRITAQTYSGTPVTSMFGNALLGFNIVTNLTDNLLPLDSAFIVDASIVSRGMLARDAANDAVTVTSAVYSAVDGFNVYYATATDPAWIALTASATLNSDGTGFAVSLNELNNGQYSLMARPVVNAVAGNDIYLGAVHLSRAVIPVTFDPTFVDEGDSDMYLGSWNIDNYLTIPLNTHNPATGAEAAATGSPSYRIYEDETATPILTGTLTALDSGNTTGFYSERIQLTAANGFEEGKSYTIRITATIAGISRTAVSTFQIRAAVSAAGVTVNLDATDVADLSADIMTVLGTGAIQVNHNSGGTDNLRYVIAGVGIDNAVIEAYLTTDYNSGNTGAAYRKGRSNTDANGRWEKNMALDAGSYTFVFYKQGEYGPDTTVAVIA